MPSTTIALTMGDPAGIGPEITIRACQALAPRIASGEISLLAVGSAQAFRRAEDLIGHQTGATVLSQPPAHFENGLALLEIKPAPAMASGAPIVPGKVNVMAGWFSYQAVAHAVDLAMAGIVDAIVTAPLNKEALNLAGYAYAGHTEMLADLTGVKNSVMMLAHGDFRVSHVSTHVPLEKVASLITPERLIRVIDLTSQTLTDLGIKTPRIAIAALNPHAGEGGIFGRQDIDITEPVVKAYRAKGAEISGPVPGDTVFVKLRANQYDAVVAMYHDQGHIPVKLLGFQNDPKTGEWVGLSGVNITLGLPIIRTSVDHGTAFDIAHKGIALADSLVEAVDYAIALSNATGKNKTNHQQGK